jgi:hypothetical protein
MITMSQVGRHFDRATDRNGHKGVLYHSRVNGTFFVPDEECASIVHLSGTTDDHNVRRHAALFGYTLARDEAQMRRWRRTGTAH